MSVFLALVCLMQAPQTVWLSDLDLSKAQQGWGLPGVNKSVEGHPLTIHGQSFQHGFGTHSPGRLVIRLDGHATNFHAEVGIDAEVPAGRGSAEFIVYGSRQGLLWRSGVLRSTDAAKTVDIPLKGQHELTLIVTDAGDGFENDHADWADAGISYEGSRPYTVDYKPTEPAIAKSRSSAKPLLNGAGLIGTYFGTPLIWHIPADGKPPLSFGATHLPDGLSLDPSSGTITGTISKQGSYTVSISAKNPAGNANKTVEMVAGDQIALTPPMGWNSYDAYGDSVTEAEVLANADLVSRRLQPFGWDTVVVDYRWYDPGAHNNDPNSRANAPLAIDANGRLLPAPNRFPSAADGRGFKALADRFHAEGLRFGVHIMRGIPRLAVNQKMPIEGTNFTADQAADVNDVCGWCPDMYGVRADTPAGQAYYDSIFRLYASWGLDFVKMDDASSPYHADEIAAAHRAILACGRSIVLSLSPGETPVEDGDRAAANANQWRESGDFWDNWSALDHEFSLAERWQKWVGQGHWPDPDMLPLGHLSVGNRSVDKDRMTRFTHSEQVSLISLWCLLPAPLMLGADLTKTDPWTFDLLTNPEVLALDQDTVTAGAQLALRKDDIDVWTRRLSDGSVAVGLFNRGYADALQPLDWAAFGIATHAHIRNLWTRTNWRQKTVSIPSHGAALFRVW